MLTLVGQGLTNHEIGAALDLSPLTAKKHVSRIMGKLRCRDRAQLVITAYETHLVTPTAPTSDPALVGMPRSALDHDGKSFGLTPVVQALPPLTGLRVSVQMVDWVAVVLNLSRSLKRW